MPYLTADYAIGLCYTSGFARGLCRALPSRGLAFTSGYARGLCRVLPARGLAFTSGPARGLALVGQFMASDLQLRPGLDMLDEGAVRVYDATGLYPDEAGGYTPEVSDPPIDPTDSRPRRSDLKLWLCYRRWTPDGAEVTKFPTGQDGSLTPWEFTVQDLEPGIYRFYLIGTPLNTVLADVNFNAAPESAGYIPGWFVGSIAALLSPVCLEHFAWTENRLAQVATDTGVKYERERERYERQLAWANGIGAQVASDRLTEAAARLEDWTREVTGA